MYSYKLQTYITKYQLQPVRIFGTHKIKKDSIKHTPRFLLGNALRSCLNSFQPHTCRSTLRYHQRAHAYIVDIWMKVLHSAFYTLVSYNNIGKFKGNILYYRQYVCKPTGVVNVHRRRWPLSIRFACLSTHYFWKKHQNNISIWNSVNIYKWISS